MTSAVSATKTHADSLEEATEEAIKAYDGNPRQAVKALLEANAELEEKLGRAVRAVSFGYSRGAHMRLVVRPADPPT